MNRSWVRFPQAAQIRPPGSGWAFLYALTGRAAWCARGRRPAREFATREPAARSGRSRSPARPRRRPRAPQPGPPEPPAPRLEAARALWAPNVVWLVVLGFWDAPMQVVTNVVNRRCFSSGFLIRCYKRRQSDGYFAENSGFWTQIDDVCNMSPHTGLQIAPV